MSNQSLDAVRQILEESSHIPLATINNPNIGVALAKAYCDAGLKNIEITLRLEGAVDVIRAIKDALPEMIVGAGTVYTTDQVEEVSKAGGAYIVSPGYSDSVNQACKDCGLPYIPGVATPGEIQQRREEGFRYLKFFPADLFGGVKALKAYESVFYDIKFWATGGVSPENAHEFLSLPNVVSVGMSRLVPMDLVEKEDWDGVTVFTKNVIS